MSSEKNQHDKTRLHPRNKNRERYDLEALTKVNPELKKYVKPNKYGDDSVDFSNPVVVKLLNQAILSQYYGIKNWDFPDENLCPPIPGRADYIHYLADLLGESNGGEVPKGDKITCLDIGVGASCIYPIIGVTEYAWQFIGSDIDAKSIASAQRIIQENPSLEDKIECRLQNDSSAIFSGILGTNEKIDLTLCNPPFHASVEEAQEGTRRKIRNLTGKKMKTPELNFSGNIHELIYEGGEYQFIKNMIGESIIFDKNCYWFTTLVSKQANLQGIYHLLEKTGAEQIKTIPMGTGNKSSRIVAWTFLNKAEQKAWREMKRVENF
jgi:23S rRNA (adenine1618-N6)-methyltransferase